MARVSGIDKELLKAALIGYQVQADRIAAIIADLQAQLGQGGRRTVGSDFEEVSPGRTGRGAGKTPAAGPRKKRQLSAVGRARIVEATKARWEAYRKEKAEKSASTKGR